MRIKPDNTQELNDSVAGDEEGTCRKPSVCPEPIQVQRQRPSLRFPSPLLLGHPQATHSAWKGLLAEDAGMPGSPVAPPGEGDNRTKPSPGRGCRGSPVAVLRPGFLGKLGESRATRRLSRFQP